jgi:hypothetical protein
VFAVLEELDLSVCALLTAPIAGAGSGLMGLHRVCLAWTSCVGWRGLEAADVLHGVTMHRCAGDHEAGSGNSGRAQPLRELRLELDKCVAVTNMGASS